MLKATIAVVLGALLCVATGCAEQNNTEVKKAAAGNNRQAKMIYVVQKGDNGFAGISWKVYGNSRYWALIRDANPDVDTCNLKPGDELVIPPLPEKDAK